jgi:hypothetical protein
MGLDFTALIRYDGPGAEVLRAIDRLERGEDEAAFAGVVAHGLRNNFAFARHAGRPACWRPRDSWDQELPHRPALPSLEASLDLPSDFNLTFGRDCVWVYHTLRWIFFVTDADWQRVMLAAVKRFCELLGASDCIVTSDWHPAVSAFRDGVSFAEAMDRASQQGEGEVASLAELYREIEEEADVALKPVRGPAGESLAGRWVRWPRDKPLPEGWSRATVWDSKGFWRCDWRGA